MSNFLVVMFWMNVIECIKKRRSIRKYRQVEVEDQKLNNVLEAGRLAPSATNMQPWHFIVVRDHGIKQKLRASYDREWFTSAPVIIVACADPDNSWIRGDGEQYWKVDVAISLQNMVLEAKEQGLGTCWIAAFNEGEAKKVLQIPPSIRVVAMTPLGYPDEVKGEVNNRKPLNEIVHFDRW